MRHELRRGVLELDKDRHKDPVLATIAREEKLGKLVQPLNPCDLVAVELDFSAWHIFHPCLFDKNRAFLGGLCGLDDVKMFSVQGRSAKGNRLIPKTARFWDRPAQYAAFKIIGHREDGLHIWIQGFNRRIS